MRRIFFRQWKNIYNAAAHCKLPRHFCLIITLVAHLRQLFKHIEAYRLKQAADAFVEELKQLGSSANLDAYLPYFAEHTVSLLGFTVRTCSG